MTCSETKCLMQRKEVFASAQIKTWNWIIRKHENVNFSYVLEP